jgi:hypothetical protein
MQEKLIKTIDLKNNVKLNLFDRSRKLVGDRWLVSLIIRMDIPVSDAITTGDGHPVDNVDDIEKLLGEKVCYEQKRERIFIDDTERAAVFKELYDNFLESTLPYLSHDAFPKRYVLKTYKEKEKKQSWYPEFRNTIRKT